MAYNGTSGVNPRMEATPEQLALDTDDDGLNLTEEAKAGTDPTKKDTDGDGLDDEWEVAYNGTSGVNPLVNATAEELASDVDEDGLNLREEAKAGADPTKKDTDGDGLPDKWEVTYNGASGVNPLIPATDRELASDIDKDGLNLRQEAKGNTDPETADNPMTMNSTMSTTKTRDATSTTDATSTMGSNVPFGEISVESSFALLVVLAIFTSFSIALVVYRVRKRVL